MRAIIGATVVISSLFAGIVAPALAFEGGGRKPSEAPLINWGQRYSGQLNNHKSDANYNGYEEVAIWQVPPLASHDLLTVNWHVLPFTSESGFPICMIFVQGINDFNWGEVFGQRSYCEYDGPVYEVSGSGTSQTAITVQESNINSSYLEFFAYSGQTSKERYETYPYDFSVEAPRHYLGVAFNPVSSITATGILSASATTADGSAAPDGLSFALTASWKENGIATYSATTSGGTLSFALSLPVAAVGKSVLFQISRAADSDYQAAASTRLRLKVEPAAPSPSSLACERARGRAHVLARQFRRLKRHARWSHGRTRHRLRRCAHHIRRKLRVARSRARIQCSKT